MWNTISGISMNEILQSETKLFKKSSLKPKIMIFITK